MARLTRNQAYKYREAILKVINHLTDAEALDAPLFFPKYEVGVEYKTDDRFCDTVDGEVVLFKVLQNHTSSAEWEPDSTPSLYVRIDDPTIEWPDWHQPVGAVDAYALGAKVTHSEKHWISDYDNNVWEPGVFGWHEATE